MHTLLLRWAALTRALTTALGFAYRRFWRPAQPPLDKATLRAALDVYKTAWEQQDSGLILTAQCWSIHCRAVMPREAFACGGATQIHYATPDDRHEPALRSPTEIHIDLRSPVQ
jgi:hypothetical protein